MGYYTQKKLSLGQKTRLLTGGGYWNSASIEAADIPAIRFTDGPSGVRHQGDKGDNLGENKSSPATCFPAHSALSCSWNLSLCREAGRRIGCEAGHFGADVLLAPAVNIKRNPLCGRNFEYFSEDPYMNGKFGAAYVSGVRESGAQSCVKHFAVNNREFARMVCDSVIDERTLREIYLTGFEIAIKEGKPAAVMTAYNRLNGVYCNENKELLEGVLRGEWGFDGIVISDWGGTRDRAAAADAGADLEMPPCKFSAEEVRAAVSEGTLDESAVDRCAERIIALAKRDKKVVQCDFADNARFARAAAEECAVLLKNDGTLPLKCGKIALIGDIAQNPLIQGGGSSKVNPKSTDSLYNCLKHAITGFERGYTASGGKRALEKRALKLCGNCDTVIFCAGHYGDAEGADRENICLPDCQTKLLKRICALGKKVVVVLFCGSAVNTDWDAEVNALLFAGLSGQAGAAAVADILVGKACPSGKLTESFPYSVESLHSSKYFNESPYFTRYGEGMNIGYRSPVKAKYPFGYGLSYTTFTYSDLIVGRDGVSFTVTNTGGVRGGEAVQMYLRFPESANSPFKQLKGFEKIFLDAGESRRVSIPFDCYAFRSYDVQSGRWATVAGAYRVYVGGSSENLPLVSEINIEGDSAGVQPPEVKNLTPSAYPLKRDKRGAVIADLQTPFCELKNAKGLFGRLFARIVLFVVRKKRTVFGSMQYLPVRTLAQYGRMNKNTAEGLILMFNGRFFKGLFRLFKRK